MRILIVGAGKVGTSVAENLVSESNDITIVDTNESRINEIQSNYDLRGIVGDATSPSTLADAGAADADMVVAVTANDETNLAITLLAEQLFNVPSRIARVRNDELREYPALLSTQGFRATSIIWPERAVTDYIVELIRYPETLQVIEFSFKGVILINVKVVKNSNMDGKPIKYIRELLPEVQTRVVAVYRQKFREESLAGSTVIEAGDEVFILVSPENAKSVIQQFRRKLRKSDRVMIVGGGSLGLQLAKSLDNIETDGGGSYNVKLVDSNQARCLYLSQHLSSSVLVLHGEMTDESLFVNEGIANTDLFIAISNDDEDNVMSCLLAKKLGAHRAIALINRTNYLDLVEGTSIDIALSPTEATLSDLLRHIRHGDVVSVHILRRGGAEVLEMVAHGTNKNSKIIGKKLREINFPEGTAFGCLVRNEGGKLNVHMSQDDLVVESGDRFIIFVGNKQKISSIEKLFSPSVSFF
ncbi:MAG: Trk system potassium transporter TrkA [Burkholderiaceae bacterium]|nr:Trk system potassium transporter TrkA [Burkholderiaceae bacterium]